MYARIRKLACVSSSIAGDDKGAKDTVTHLLDQFGFDTVCLLYTSRRRLIAHRDAVPSLGRPRLRLISPRPRLVPRFLRGRGADLSHGRRPVAQRPQLLSEEPRLVSVAGALVSEAL